MDERQFVHGGDLPSSDVVRHYVIVRSDLPRGLAGVQIIHAAGESARLAETLPPGTHAVALVAHDEAALAELGHALDAASIVHVKIVENDPPYTDQLLAIGLAPVQRSSKLKRLLERLPLLR